MNEENIVIVKLEEIEPPVSRADGCHSHNLSLSKNLICLIPRTPLTLTILVVMSLLGAIYFFIKGDMFECTILSVFYWFFYLFIKKGRGFDEVQLDVSARIISIRNERYKSRNITVGFEDVEHFQTISRIKSGGNGSLIKISDLNAVLKNSQRLGLATGSEGIINDQATALAEALNCEVYREGNG
ncbi:MAG: hypothetical protein ACI936_000023 [Paraglaciecola sp.]